MTNGDWIKPDDEKETERRKEMPLSDDPNRWPNRFPTPRPETDPVPPQKPPPDDGD